SLPSPSLLSPLPLPWSTDMPSRATWSIAARDQEPATASRGHTRRARTCRSLASRLAPASTETTSGTRPATAAT
ncbi:hypothetical protein LPJ56_006360, partial [Coemansia sp. RSA 2599]